MTGQEFRRLREKLGCTQRQLADKLRRTQQSIAWVESRPTLTDRQAESLRREMLKAFPDREQQDLIGIAFGERSHVELDLNRARVVGLSRQDPPTDPILAEIEPEALPWAISFRTDYLLDRLGALARGAGLTVVRLTSPRYGLILGKRDDPVPAVAVAQRRGDRPLIARDELLFPRAPLFGLSAGTIVLIGSSFRKRAVNLVMTAICNRLGVRLWFEPDKDRDDRHKFFFGYPTRFNDLYVNGRPFRSNRYVDERDAIHYEDYGVILHGPLAQIVAQGEEKPFGEEAKTAQRVVLVAGAHRLATGIGMRMLEDAQLRSLVLDTDLTGFGALAFRVVVRKGDFSTVTDLERIPVP